MQHTTAPLGFALTVSQNPYLWLEDREMHAVITVSATHPEPRDGPVPAAEPDARQIAEVIVIDCSGSMGYPSTKIAAARRATKAAVDMLPDGVRFAIVKGTSTSSMVYPDKDALAVASAQTRAEAKQAVAGLDAYGGTAIGSWLSHTRRLMEPYPSAVRHALLLTDGHNQHETAAQLTTALDECAGHFVCDARGIGDDWHADELLRITSVLRGAARAVTAESELRADFEATMQAALRKLIPDLRLRISTTPQARLRFIKQVYPTETALTDATAAIGARAADFSTGSWGAGDVRAYHLCLDLDRGDSPEFEDLRVARVDLLLQDRRQTDPVPVLVHWTHDRIASSVVDSDVAHYLGWEGFQHAIAAGCRAYERGDPAAAQAEWGDAARWAATHHDQRAMAVLERLVEITDAATGQVRIKEGIQPIWLHTAQVGASHTSRPHDDPTADRPDQPTGPEQICPKCERRAPAGAAFCEQCNTRLGSRPAPGVGT
ncbi:VWA domain-containing protein [Micromonospora sp. SL1-18]|uniref:VWA domain-containing protein n=1 Tax=Micromonospora sp. SL1-18 TaxID=3399128 RepID=UPI003A4E5DAF